MDGIEIFHSSSEYSKDDLNLDEGWYWWSCQLGCLPDGEPNGPFDTEEEAEADAREETEGLNLESNSYHGAFVK